MGTQKKIDPKNLSQAEVDQIIKKAMIIPALITIGVLFGIKAFLSDKTPSIEQVASSAIEEKSVQEKPHVFKKL